MATRTWGKSSVVRRNCRIAASLFCIRTRRYVVPAEAVHLLPDDVPPGRAVLAANLETAINGLWDTLHLAIA